MKRLLLITALSFASLLQVSAQEDSSAEEIAAALKSGSFEIVIGTVYPQAGMPVHDSGYSVKFCDGKVTTVLPFFGTSDTASFSYEDSSIVLNEVPVKIKPKKSKDKWTFSFNATSGSNKWEIETVVWDNGRCDLICTCTSKSIMRYDGELVIPSEGD